MENQHIIAFYNLENLFDTQDNPYTLDDDFLPWGRKYWTKKRYEKKLYKLADTIADIGYKEVKKSPAIVGLAEVENAFVIEDLIQNEELNFINYDYVHYDSPDERGIDVALLYNQDDFTLIESEAIPMHIVEKNGVKDYTRDALYVFGLLGGDKVHIIVTHWPSRRDGASLTEHKRIQAAKQIINFLQVKEIPESEKIIMMGDFNDNPSDTSVKKHLVNDSFFNPFESLLHPTKGSLNHRGEWFLFDQIILSHNFLAVTKSGLQYDKSAIFNDYELQEWNGKYKNSPFRTYRGKRYLGGVSDHFPVYISVLSK